MCKNSNGILTVEHYQNVAKSTPQLLDRNDPALGYSNIRISLINDVLMCSFTRAKNGYSHIANYYDLSKPFHILTASGPIIDGINFIIVFLLLLLLI